jgi:esterase/lipase
MRMKHYVIYIPGLGDNSDVKRRFALSFWKIYRMKTELVPMQWYDNKSYEEKVKRVNDAINKALANGYRVSLIGESAGGSMALNIAASRSDLYKIITVAGVNASTMSVSDSILRRSPAFKRSIHELRKSLNTLDKTKVETVRGLFDRSVSAKYTFIEDAHNHIVFSFTHLMTTSLCLTIYSAYIVHLIKRGV